MAIERVMGIRHIESVFGLCREIAAVNLIGGLAAKAPQEIQSLKVGLIGIEGRFKQKLLVTTGRA